jgi:hypothetical protein
VAKPNYSFQKRQRELAKKQKKEEKQQEKNQRKAQPAFASDDATADSLSPVPASAGTDEEAGET